MTVIAKLIAGVVGALSCGFLAFAVFALVSSFQVDQPGGLYQADVAADVHRLHIDPSGLTQMRCQDTAHEFTLGGAFHADGQPRHPDVPPSRFFSHRSPVL